MYPTAVPSTCGRGSGSGGAGFLNSQHRRLNKDIIRPADTEFFELLYTGTTYQRRHKSPTRRRTIRARIRRAGEALSVRTARHDLRKGHGGKLLDFVAAFRERLFQGRRQFGFDI